MAQVLGRAEYFVNSIKMGTIAGGTIDVGGEVRETVRGQFGPLGYKVTDVAPGAAEFEVASTSDLDLADLDVTEATVVIITDTGDTYLIVNATRVGDPLSVAVDAGTISVRLAGKVAQVVA